nr:uncharacterized protein LOC129438635 [Misgurnus anguillicaudatus]
MILTVVKKSLVWIFLFFTLSAQDHNLDPQTLARIVKTFESKLGQSGQYAVAFRVEKEKCLANSKYSGEDLITDEVKNKIQNNEVYVSNNLIGAKALKGKKTEHSEFRLKNHLKDILNVKDKCVIFFTVNSPCLTTCLADNGQYTIKSSLTMLQAYQGIKALAFKKVWKQDTIEALKAKLMAIAHNLPSYQCESNNAGCKRLFARNSQTHENDMTILNL